MSISHAQARSILEGVRPGNGDAWYQAVQAISVGEGQYGNGWTGEGAGSNNWGATQCNHGPPCGDDCFPHIDHHADGTSYTGCFQRFATPEIGADHYVAILTRIMNRHPGEALTLGDGGVVGNPGDSALEPNADGLVSAEDIAYTMHAGGYFELAPNKYADAIYRHAQTVASAMGEPLYVVRESLLEQGGGSGGGGFGIGSTLLTIIGIWLGWKAVT